MVGLLKATSSKKRDFLSPISYPLSIAPHLGMGAYGRWLPGRRWICEELGGSDQSILHLSMKFSNTKTTIFFKKKVLHETKDAHTQRDRNRDDL